MSEPLTREMKDISFNNSFGFRPKAETCCKRCAFGSGEHEEWCEKYKACSSCNTAGHSLTECDLPLEPRVKSGRGRYRGKP